MKTVSALLSAIESQYALGFEPKCRYARTKLDCINATIPTQKKTSNPSEVFFYTRLDSNGHDGELEISGPKSHVSMDFARFR